MQPRPVRAILHAGLLAGVLDITALGVGLPIALVLRHRRTIPER